MQVYLKIDFLQRLKERSIHLFFEPAKSNESITSWICRNAISNYIDPNDFVKSWINYHSAFHRDFDYKPIKEIQQWITYMSPRRMPSEACLTDFHQLAFAFNLSRSKPSPLIIDGTISHQRKHQPQFCPKCLQEPSPYFKLDWKFSLIFGCSSCGCYLQNVCPNCNNTQQLMKLKFLTEEGFIKINQCSTCHHLLSKAESKTLSNEEIGLNNWISQIIGLGSISKQDQIKASLLFDLCNVLCSRNHLGDITRDFFSISTSNNYFHAMPANERAMIIKTAKKWIDDFYLITSKINEAYSISRHHWKSFIHFPDGTLNP